MPKTVKFDTDDQHGRYGDPWFEFSNDLTGMYAFSI